MGFSAGQTIASTAVSSGATSADVFYTPNGTTVSSKAFRITGYLEYLSGLAVEHHKTGEMVWLPLSDAAGDLFSRATAGTYGSAPTNLQLFGPGIKKARRRRADGSRD